VGPLSEAERAYLASERIGRLATVGPTGFPHVMPVRYTLTDEGALEFDADGIKLRNLSAEPRVAFVVDGMGPRRGVAIQGLARVIGPERARLEPQRVFAWGLE
jgi:pyridoxamine 5'-phosphate oxidase family protein